MTDEKYVPQDGIFVASTEPEQEDYTLVIKAEVDCEGNIKWSSEKKEVEKNDD